MTIPSMELTGIFIYPVKSLRGVRLDDAPLLDGRLVGDRTWLLVNKFGRFMHMRDYPQMARVEATITERGLTVRTDTMPSLEIEPPPTSLGHSSDVTHVRLWRRSAPVVAVGTWCAAGSRLEITQRFQTFSATLSAAASPVPFVFDGRIEGSTLRAHGMHTFELRIEGDALRTRRADNAAAPGWPAEAQFQRASSKSC